MQKLNVREHVKNNLIFNVVKFSNSESLGGGLVRKTFFQ